MRCLVTAIARLLSRFADPTHPALREPPLKGHQMADTGVTAHFNSQRPSIVKFAFMATINKGSPYEDSKQVAIDFDMDQLERHGQEYIKGTVVRVTKAIEMFAEADARKEDGVLTLH